MEQEGTPAAETTPPSPIPEPQKSATPSGGGDSGADEPAAAIAHALAPGESGTVGADAPAPEAPSNPSEIERACEAMVGRPLYAADAANRCRWPCASDGHPGAKKARSENDFHRCKRKKTAIDTGLCSQHERLAKKALVSPPETESAPA